MATRKKTAPKSKSKKSTSKSPVKAKAKRPAPRKAVKKATKPLAKKAKVASVKARMARSLAKRPPVAQPEPETTAPPMTRVPTTAAPRPQRRVSIGEALAQLNAATLEGVTAELVPFGLNPDVPLTPSTSLGSLIGPEARPLSALVAALESWDGEGADLMLINEARSLLDTVPRIAEDLEAFVRRNCTM